MKLTIELPDSTGCAVLSLIYQDGSGTKMSMVNIDSRMIASGYVDVSSLTGYAPVGEKED